MDNHNIRMFPGGQFMKLSDVTTKDIITVQITNICIE